MARIFLMAICIGLIGCEAVKAFQETSTPRAAPALRIASDVLGGIEEESYAEAINPKRIEIYAKPSPETIERVTAFDELGVEHELWKGAPPQAEGKAEHVGSFSIDSKIETNRIKIYIDDTASPKWIYYDAVGMEDAAGKIQWVDHAQASSSYAKGEIPINKYQCVADMLQRTLDDHDNGDD